MGRVASEYSQPFDYQNLPQLTSANAPSSLNTGVKDYSGALTTGFNFGAPLPQFDSSYRDTVANQLMQKMQPQHDYQQRQLETKLSNMGFRPGTEGYDRELNNMAQRQAAERYNALDTAGKRSAASLQHADGHCAAGLPAEPWQAAQFQNQALGQGERARPCKHECAQNNAMSQQFGLNQQYANAQNQLRQQAIAEEACSAVACL